MDYIESRIGTMLALLWLPWSHVKPKIQGPIIGYWPKQRVFKVFYSEDEIAPPPKYWAYLGSTEHVLRGNPIETYERGKSDG